MKQPEEMNYNELCVAGIISYYTARNFELLQEYEQRLATGEKVNDILQDMADRLNLSTDGIRSAVGKARRVLRG